MTHTDSLDRLADLTPTTRDRSVDALRAGCIVVVVLWHWVLSITHWTGTGTARRLSMPNPLDQITGGWALTWVLQVMPLFFVIGGFANTAAWTAARRDGTSPGSFVIGRLRRLGRPVAVFAATWLTVEVARLGLGVGPTTSVLTWGLVVFVPLWFVVVYGAVCAVSPWLVDRIAVVSWPVLAVVVAIADAGRLAAGWTWLGVVSTAGTWIACHQLGVWWRSADLADRARRVHLAIAAAGLAGLVVCTASGAYPASMVARSGDTRSNLLPTSLPVIFVGVLQLGLALLARPAINRWTARRRVWRTVIAANGVAMTVLTWHMTAFLIVAAVWQWAGGTLGAHAGAGWWQQRPFWLAGPGIVLVAIVALASRFERPRVVRATSGAASAGEGDAANGSTTARGC